MEAANVCGAWRPPKKIAEQIREFLFRFSMMVANTADMFDSDASSE
jgi:hypothetical protein